MFHIKCDELREYNQKISEERQEKEKVTLSMIHEVATNYSKLITN